MNIQDFQSWGSKGRVSVYQ